MAKVHHPTIKMMLLRERTCKEDPLLSNGSPLNKFGIPEGSTINCQLCSHKPFAVMKKLVNHYITQHAKNESEANIFF
jgi:hypothetical protein